MIALRLGKHCWWVDWYLEVWNVFPILWQLLTLSSEEILTSLLLHVENTGWLDILASACSSVIAMDIVESITSGHVEEKRWGACDRQVCRSAPFNSHSFHVWCYLCLGKGEWLLTELGVILVCMGITPIRNALLRTRDVAQWSRPAGGPGFGPHYVSPISYNNPKGEKVKKKSLVLHICNLNIWKAE